jgi:hypothetical protein
MFDNFLILKEEINKIKVSQKKPFGLTTEKITQSPRSFNLSQIKEATENLAFTEEKEGLTLNLLLRAAQYILKDFFIYMHQSGLYNRQLALWKTLGNITQCNIYRLKKGLIKKQLLEIFVIDFFIDPKAPCISAILETSTNQNTGEDCFKSLKYNLLNIISRRNIKRLKGIFYFLNSKPDSYSLNNLIIDAFDPVAKYESLLNWTKDVRLNVVTFNEMNEDYKFEHIYPQLQANREMLLKK